MPANTSLPRGWTTCSDASVERLQRLEKVDHSTPPPPPSSRAYHRTLATSLSFSTTTSTHSRSLTTAPTLTKQRRLRCPSFTNGTAHSLFTCQPCIAISPAFRANASFRPSPSARIPHRFFATHTPVSPDLTLPTSTPN